MTSNVVPADDDLVEAQRIVGNWLVNDVGYYEALPANYEIRQAIDAVLKASRASLSSRCRNALEEARPYVVDRCYGGLTAADAVVRNIDEALNPIGERE